MRRLGVDKRNGCNASLRPCKRFRAADGRGRGIEGAACWYGDVRVVVSDTIRHSKGQWLAPQGQLKE